MLFFVWLSVFGSAASSCVDSDAVDCDVLNSMIDICNLADRAKKLCPNYCNVCDVVQSGWTEWNEWSPCSTSCGIGMQSRERTCTDAVPNIFEHNCIGNSREVQLCYPGACADGSWSDWQTCSKCSGEQCGTGIRQRSRTCSNPKPSPLGNYCIGNSIEISSCETTCQPCLSNPCHNDNSITKGESFECLCSAGYNGRFCENDIDECRSLPCLHGSCTDQVNGYTCTCFDGCSGLNCKTVLTDCYDLYHLAGKRTDGVYTIITWNTHQKIQVYCDMTTDEGGWTVFQYRFNGSVEFYRNFTEYEKGFGNLNTEFWLGLNYIQEISNQGQTDLRIDLESVNGTRGFEKFENFYLSSSPDFTLHLGQTTDSLHISDSYRFGSFHNGSKFTTYDKDVDSSGINCAETFHGAFWYKNCHRSNLNGKYITPGINDAAAMIYQSFMYYPSLKRNKMMMKRT